MDFLGSLLDAFGGIGSVVASIIDILNYLFNLILYAATVIYNFVVALGNYLLSAIQGLARFLSHIWTSFFKGIFGRVLHWLSVAHDWLEAKLRPILNFLKRVRQLYDAWFLHYVKPFLQLLQHIRQFLQILRLLHINIAAQLDSILGQIESRITSAFLQFRSLLNNSIDLLNILADPTLLLRKPTLVISIRRTIPAIIRAATGLPPGFFFPSPRGSGGGAFKPVPANFNPRDPAMNPPASAYLAGEDGLAGFGGFALASVPTDGAVDDLTMLDYFADDLYAEPACSDPVQCLAASLQLLAPKVANG